MFPGSTEDLVARGRSWATPRQDGRYFFGPQPLASGHADLPALGVSRPLLEWYLRHRLLRDFPVTLLDRTSVLDLAFSADERRVVGLIVSDCDAGSPRLLPALLVVDASGRPPGRRSGWSGAADAAPEEDVRRVDKHYATRTFRRPRRPGEPIVVDGPFRARPPPGRGHARPGGRRLDGVSHRT